MQPDDKLCYCFHVSRRKVINFLRVNKPRVPSQLSECGGAGTGCGWCIRFLRQHFEDWRQGCENGPVAAEMTAEEYAAARADYIRSGGGVPPESAEQLPPPDAPAG